MIRESAAPVSYSAPVDTLLTLGTPAADVSAWIEYGTLGITSADIRTLIAMMVDVRLHRSSTPAEYFSPVHAWRALAQLRAVEAVAPLIELHAELADDYLFQDVPKVMARIGPDALPALFQALRRTDINPFVRGSIAEAIAAIGVNDSDVSEECASAIATQLEGFADQDIGFNGLLVSALLDLDAVVHAEAIGRAMNAGRVDELLVGDWEDVQTELGLLTSRTSPRRSYFERYTEQRSLGPGNDSGTRDEGDRAMRRTVGNAGAPRGPSRAKQKAKRKLAKASRRRNRK